MTDTRRPAPRAESERGVIGSVLVWLTKGVHWLLLALVFSILLEWLGLIWWWPAEGVAHSRQLLDAELGYLGEAVPRHLLTAQPAQFARQWGRRLSQRVFEWARLHQLITWATTPPVRGEARLQIALRRFVTTLSRYLLTAEQSLQLFGARLAILMLALPVLGLSSLVAIVDGLVQRDLRRWGGGRESGFIYHWAKQVAMPLAMGVWLVYLIAPVSMHPDLVIITFATLLGLALTVTVATFKKYL